MSRPRISRRALLRVGSAAGALSLIPVGQSADGGRDLAPPLADVRLGDTPQQVLAVLGGPRERTSVHGNGSAEWRYESLVVQFLTESPGQKVMNIALQASGAGSTDTGVRVGDAMREVFDRYGASVIDNDQGSFTVPIEATARLTFEGHRLGYVAAISLRRLTCATCKPVAAPTIIRKKP